jgi:hypothetical protein
MSTEKKNEKWKTIRAGFSLWIFICAEPQFKNRRLRAASLKNHAALVAAFIAAGSSQRTDTSFETPGSCMVTP